MPEEDRDHAEPRRATPSSAPAPATPSNAPAPATPSNAPAPAPATPSNAPAPATPSNAPAPAPAKRSARPRSPRGATQDGTAPQGKAAPSTPSTPQGKAAPGTRGPDSILPDGFHFGVATAGFQVEGGFNGPGEPSNNWALWEAAGKVEPSGVAVNFWNTYEEQLDRVASMGCDAFRLSVEWARIERRSGDIDEEAVQHYRKILQACHKRHLMPLVTLHHFTHPAWLGMDFWLSSDSVERFAGWAEVAVNRFGDLCRHWITLNEINILGSASYLFGMFPPGRRMASREAAVVMDHMLAAHIKAYEVIHRLQADAMVTTNNASASIYEFDRLLMDVLVAPKYGVHKDAYPDWIEAKRAEWYAELPPPDALETVLRKIVARASMTGLGGEGGRAWRAAHEGEHPCAMDMVGIDYYDPVASHHVRWPGHRTAGGRNWLPARNLWDDVVNPEGLITYCRAAARDGLPVWIVENGLGTRVRNGRAYPRLDGWDRSRYIRENLGAMARAIEGGIPVTAYFHWTLADNYEWGSYQPRFGIFGVDRERATRVLDTDSLGGDAAQAYREMIGKLRATT